MEHQTFKQFLEAQVDREQQDIDHDEYQGLEQQKVDKDKKLQGMLAQGEKQASAFSKHNDHMGAKHAKIPKQQRDAANSKHDADRKAHVEKTKREFDELQAMTPAEKEKWRESIDAAKHRHADSIKTKNQKDKS